MNQPRYKLAYTAAEAVELLPWGKTKVHEMIAAGEIPSRFKHGRRYILHEDLMSVLTSEEVSQPETSTAANVA